MDLIGHKYDSFVQKEIQKRAAAARKEVGVDSRNSSSMGVLLCCCALLLPRVLETCSKAAQ
jgi:hypothetical protein